MEAKTEKPEKSEAQVALGVFRDLTRRHGIDGTYQSIWPGLYFTERGVGRLMATAGFIDGLAAAGKVRLAEKLALDLHQRLTYLADYGGKEEFVALRGVDGGHDDVEAYITENVLGKGMAKRFAVVLGDDGTFGGFTIAWYRHIDDATRVRALSAGQEDPAYGRGTLYEVLGSRGIERPVSVPGQDRVSWVKLHYRYAFNGGLLCHGMGQEVFAVDISGDAGPHWSIHT
jgi:hypothetical protein